MRIRVLKPSLLPGFSPVLVICGVVNLILTWSCPGQGINSNTPPGYSRPEFLRTNMVRVPNDPPAEILNWLNVREDAQNRQAYKRQAYHDFQLVDRQVESGIQFHHRVVDDAGKYFKAAHYDHGSGLAVADIDGDGLLDIFFVNQLGSSQLWRNLGGGKFEDITTKAGVGLADRSSVGASFADIDNDGRPDLFVTTVRGGNALFHNLGNGRFEDISKAAGVDYVGHSSGAVFFDFNRDGLLDLFVCNVGKYTSDQKGADGLYQAYEDAFLGHTIPGRTEQSILYQNLGGLKFRDVSRAMHLEHRNWSGDATFCDLNSTGYPSLYVISMSGRHAFYFNLHGKRFRDDIAEVFGKTSFGAMGLKFFDFNQDGWFDLFVTDMHSDMTPPQTEAGRRNAPVRFEKEKSDSWCAVAWNDAYVLNARSNYIFGNAFYLNQRGNAFKEVSQTIGAETYWPWGISVGDLNADGFEDVFVTAGMGFPYRYAINSLLLNEGGREFFDAEFVLGIEPRKGNKTEIEYFVLDCGGADKNHQWCRNRHDKLTVMASTSSRSSAFFDLDNDGDLDLVVNNMDDVPSVLVSNLSEKKAFHYLKIRLKGKSSNADGLGALVKIRAGGRVWSQFNDGKSGYLSQSSMPLYFGLGDATSIDAIQVLWPSGKKQSLSSGLVLNTTLAITEPE